MALANVPVSMGPITRPTMAKKPGFEFSQILAQKKETAKNINNIPLVVNNNVSALNKAYDNIVNNHESSIALVKDAMSNVQMAPKKLIELQFNTGMKFLTTQLFCKTIETSAGAVKNFTQMQV